MLVTTETGIFGGVVFLLIIYEFIKRITKDRFSKLRKSNWLLVYSVGFFSLLIIGLFDHYLWSLSFGLMLFWLVLGLWLKREREV